MASLDHRLNPLFSIKECMTCGALYTRNCGCSKGSLEDKILVPKPPQNCATCGNPVDGLYCRSCAFVRKCLNEGEVWEQKQGAGWFWYWREELIQVGLWQREIALWQSQREDHTSDWLRVVPISGLGQTMNGKTYRSVLCYRLGVPLFSVSKPCSACSRVFAGDIYGDHVVSCVGTIGIKHCHNMVRDTLVDICFRSGISAGKEVDIGLDGGWMTDFVLGRAVTDAAHRKRGKYMAKCTAIGYGFLPFSLSFLGELETDAVTLLKRVRKFSTAQDIGVRVAVHTFNRIREIRADVSAPDWSAYNILVPSEADQSFAEQSEADTSALVPSLSCAAHVRKTLIIYEVKRILLYQFSMHFVNDYYKHVVLKQY
ncbi:hypothetical protein Tco_0900880 [Tanacetum coccineum]